MRKIFTFLLALLASVGMSWATDPIVIATNTGQSSYTQGSITVSVGEEAEGDGDGFILNNDNPASISNSGSSTISKIELVPGWFLNHHSYVRANGAQPNSSSEELITFLNVNSNEVTLSCSDIIFIKEVRIYFEQAGGGSTPDWVRDGDTWDEDTKTLTVNSNTGDNAYASQTEIKHLIVSDAVTELGWGTFFFDSLMTTVELGNNLEIIGISAFNECRSLSTITVPASVTNIKVRAFRNCTSLTTFTCEAVTPPTIGNAIFENDNNLTAIYVPAASVDAYKSAWSAYASLIEAAAEPDPEPVVNVKLIEFQVPASWENDNSPISSADFPDFVATTYEIASALPVTSEPSVVVFDFPEIDEMSIYTKMGGEVSDPSTGTFLRKTFFDQQTQIHYYYPVLAGDDPQPTGVENVQTNHVQGTKILRDGQLFIEKNGKIYNVMGAEVK